MSQVDAGTGVGLSGVVMPQKWNKATRSQDNRWKKRAGNVLDNKTKPTLLVAECTQRLAKKAETKGQAPPAAKTGHTAIGMGAKAKEIEEINSEESDHEGAQAQAGAKRAGKTTKRPKTKRRASMPVKGGRQTIGVGAKANNRGEDQWDESDTKNPGGRADDKSLTGYDTPPLSLRWGMEELQQRVYQERTAASVFAVAVTNARLFGMGGIDEAKAAIQAILIPWKGRLTALEGALDLEASKAWAYIAVLADYQGGFTLLYNLQRVEQELRPGNLIRAWVVAFGGEVQTNNGTPDVFVFKEDKKDLFKRLYLPRVLVTETVKAYKQDSNGDYTHTFVLDPTAKDRKAKPTTRMMPIPLEWAPMLVDNSDFGTAIRQMQDLFMSITDDKKYCLVKIFGMMTRACCVAKASDGAGST
jgi:hypothetical protein